MIEGRERLEGDGTLNHGKGSPALPRRLKQTPHMAHREGVAGCCSKDCAQSILRRGEIQHGTLQRGTGLARVAVFRPRGKYGSQKPLSLGVVRPHGGSTPEVFGTIVRWV